MAIRYDSQKGDFYDTGDTSKRYKTHTQAALAANEGDAGAQKQIQANADSAAQGNTLTMDTYTAKPVARLGYDEIGASGKSQAQIDAEAAARQAEQERQAKIAAATSAAQDFIGTGASNEDITAYNQGIDQDIYDEVLGNVPGLKPEVEETADRVVYSPSQLGLTPEEVEVHGEGSIIDVNGKKYRVDPMGNLVGESQDTPEPFNQGASLSPEQIDDYFASQSGAENPLSPAEYLASLSGGETPNFDAVQGVIDGTTGASGGTKVVDPMDDAKRDANDKLESVGVTNSSPDPGEDPVGFLTRIYNSVLDNTNLDILDERADTLLDEINAINDEEAEKLTTINENPWLSEAARSASVTRTQEKFNMKRAGRKIQYEALLAEAAAIRENARWLAGTAMSAYFQDRQMDLNESQFAWQKAEAARKAAAEKSSLGPGLTAAEIKEYRARLYANEEMTKLVDDYLTLVQRYGKELPMLGDPEVRGQMMTLRGQITSAYKQAKALGALDQGVLDLIDMVIGFDPTNAKNFYKDAGTIEAALKNLKGSIRRDGELSAGLLGVELPMAFYTQDEIAVQYAKQVSVGEVVELPTIDGYNAYFIKTKDNEDGGDFEQISSPLIN